MNERISQRLESVILFQGYHGVATLELLKKIDFVAEKWERSSKKLNSYLKMHFYLPELEIQKHILIWVRFS